MGLLAVEDIEGLVDRVVHVPGDVITGWARLSRELNAPPVSAAEASSEPPASGTAARRRRSQRNPSWSPRPTPLATRVGLRTTGSGTAAHPGPWPVSSAAASRAQAQDRVTPLPPWP